MKSSYGLELLAEVVDGENSTREYSRLNLEEDLFLSSEKDQFDALDGYFRKFGSVPPRSWMTEQGLELPESRGVAPEFYREKVIQRNQYMLISKEMKVLGDLLKAKQVPEAVERLSELNFNLTMRTTGRHSVVDYNADALDMLKRERIRMAHEGGGIPFGWPHLDSDSGMQGGDVVSIVGRPASGKTYLSLHIALNAWKNHKCSVLFVSMEMSQLQITQRVASMDAKIAMDCVKSSEMSDSQRNKLYSVLSVDKGQPFYVVDGNLTASVDSVFAYAAQLKPDLVVIDGAYLLTGKALAKHEKIANNIEQLKQRVAVDLNVPVVASYQFNREMTKQKEKSDVGLQHIAGSDAIGQISSVVLGVHSQEDGSDLFQKEVEVLKGRSGETGVFTINWRFAMPDPMNFSEVTDEFSEYGATEEIF